MPEFNSPPPEDQYDFIFCGMGCASLSIVMRMIRSGKFSDKKILLIDKEPKTKNDRTWCFWEKENGFFDEIVYRKWPAISFRSNDFSAELDIAPYEYKMIRGIDFYNFCLDEIRRHKNIDIVYTDLQGWGYVIYDSAWEFKMNGQIFRNRNKKAEVFSSIYKPVAGKKTIRLLQHFKGWIIETNSNVFNPGVATIMDFRVDQDRGTTFAYVLPFTERSALVEYTLFTPDLLKEEEYNTELKKYISEFLKIGDYRIKEQEYGVIPMTNEKFSFNSDKGWMIGTAGGQTKASSGFTFQFIQKQSSEIVKRLISGETLLKMPGTSKRFRFYDNVLLDILYHKKLPGEKIFTRLFKKNKPQQVLRFLDNESGLSEELKIISTLPTFPFLKAAMKQL